MKIKTKRTIAEIFLGLLVVMPICTSMMKYIIYHSNRWEGAGVTFLFFVAVIVSSIAMVEIPKKMFQNDLDKDDERRTYR